MPRGNVNNLVRNVDRSPDELREMTRKGGKASGRVRAEKKTLKAALSLIMDYKPSDEQIEDLQRNLGEPVKDIDVRKMISLAQAVKAMSGDTQAATWVRDTIGEKPTEKSETTLSGAEGINFTLKVVGDGH